MTTTSLIVRSVAATIIVACALPGIGLTACHTADDSPHPAPFSQPQPTPDWSDPAKQCRASCEMVECIKARPSTLHPGWWRLVFRVRVVANSSATTRLLGDEICVGIASVGPQVATISTIDGAAMSLVVPVTRSRRADDLAIYDPVLATTPMQRPDGEWECLAVAVLYSATTPTGELKLSFDGEALRRVFAKRYPGLACIPVGGLTGKVSVFQVPAATPDQRNAKPTEGSGIGVSPPVR